jgi:hypothetical protein
VTPANSTERVRVPPRPVQGLFIVGTALAVWWPAFTIGAWGTLFFDQLLTVWVISTAACLIVLVQPRPAHHRIRRAIALGIPSIWLFLSFFTDPGDDELLVIVDLLAIFIAVTGLPLTLWVMLKLFWPEAMGRMPKRLTVAAVVIVGGIAIGSFALGANHRLFLTCEDFAISGNSEPPGCVKAGVE